MFLKRGINRVKKSWRHAHIGGRWHVPDASGLTIPSKKKRIRQRMTGMYCTKCGAKLPRDAKFCMNCGKPVAAIAPAKVVELKTSPANAAVPTKVVEPTAAPAKEGAPAKAAAPAASFEEAAALAAPSAKTVVSAFASEAADAGRHDASPSDHPSNVSSQNGSASFGSLQSDSSFSDPSSESAAFADEPEKSCGAGACGASSMPQEDASPKRPETLRGAVNATKHRSRRRVPMIRAIF